MAKIGYALTYAPMACAFAMVVYTVVTVLSKIHNLINLIGG